MNKGILLLACGHGNYGRMAAALAASIKAIENIPIALLWHGNGIKYLSDQEKGLFDKLIELEDKYVHNKDGSFNPIKARLFYYELTPFKETLAVDVDNVWLNRKKPSDVFNELSDVSFSIQNAGHTVCDDKADQHYSVWANIHDVISAYDLQGKKFYRTYGEWIYFKKDPAAKKLFFTAKKIFLSKPKAEMRIENFIGQSITDELAFSIAMAQTEIYPHKDDYHPTTYYHVTSLAKNRFAQPYQLAEKYYTISMGGSVNAQYTIRNYNILVTAAYQKLKLQKPFQWVQKRSFLEERKTA